MTLRYALSRLERPDARRAFGRTWLWTCLAGAAVTLVARRAHHEEHRPGDLHRQLIRILAGLSDAPGATLVRAVHDQTRGWQWVTEPL